MGLEHLLLAERKSSKNFVNGTLKEVKEKKIKKKIEVLDLSKDPGVTRFDKKELNEKFITENRKCGNIKCVVETNKEECENSRTSSQKVKSPLPLSYAEVTKTGRMKKEVNFSEVYLNLLETEQTNSAKMETTRPTLCTNSSECVNSSFSLAVSKETELFSTQDREFVSIIVDLENLDYNSDANAGVTKTGRTEKEVDFSELYLNLLETERTSSAKLGTTPPTLCTNSSECQNSSCSLVESNKTEIFSTQDRELASILEDLENIDNSREANATEKTSLSGYFCSDTIFNLSWKVLTDSEIKVLEKDLDYAPIPSKINKPEMISNSFAEGCALGGIFIMSLPVNSVRHLHLHPSLRGNHLKVIFLSKYF